MNDLLTLINTSVRKNNTSYCYSPFKTTFLDVATFNPHNNPQKKEMKIPVLFLSLSFNISSKKEETK